MELLKRTIVGIFGGSAFIFMLLYSKWTYFFLFGFIKTMVFWEFQKLTGRGHSYTNFILLLVSISIYCFAFAVFMDYITNYRLVLLFLCILPSCFLLLFLFNIKYDFNNVCVDILKLCYITLPFSIMHYLLLVKPYLYNKLILIFFLLIWTNDSGAYFVGKAIGKTKLFRRVSPKKTWEGFFGGVILTFVVSYLLCMIFEEQLCWYILALLISIMSTLGDLVASSIKRTFNVKDSGVLLPGHGGFLDRFDSFLVTLPFFLLFIYSKAI